MFLESKDRIEFFFNESVITDFSIVNFGHEKCLPNHSFGPQVREYYVIHYILYGKGCFKFADHNYKLSKGNFFMISPDILDPIYQADEQEPWEYIWFGFDGRKVTEILNKLGYHNENRVGEIKHPRIIEKEINYLLKSNYLSNSSSLSIQGKLIELISRFSLDGENFSLNTNLTATDRHIERFILYVRQNYWKNDLTVQKIADELNVNSSYLSRIIKKKFNQSTVDYLINFRMLKAKFLLENSDHTVTMISKAVGYQNPLSFSRAYKRIFGHSPRA